MSRSLTVACIQVNAGTDYDTNLNATGALIRQAHGDGAAFIATPENVSLLVLGRKKVLANALPEESHPALPFFRDIAAELGIWLLVGSLAIKLDEETVANRSYLLDDGGRIVSRYDKIHMFDVDLEGGESYRESAIYQPGNRAVTVQTPWTQVGMTICYDVRFAYLYRALAQAGAEILTVPAAFTVPTGTAHWHVLLRARAIETGCFVLAPAQCGEHDEGRRTYGHSLIIDPWGQVLAEASGDQPGVISATLDLDRVQACRAMVPALTHDRRFEMPEPAGV